MSLPRAPQANSHLAGLSMSLWGLIGTVVLFVCTATGTVTLPGQVAAATSNTLNFQARLETASGAIAPDGNYNVEFKLYNASSSSGSPQGSCTGDANCLWVETRTSANQVRVVNGYLTVNLGSVTTLPSINWSQQLWLTMNIGGTEASPVWDGEMNPRIQLTAVPYAFTANQLSAASGSNVATLSFGSITASDSITLPDASGTVCLQNATACGFAPAIGGTGYVNLQATTPGTVQTGNFNISGTGVAGGLQAGSLDTAAAGALSIGTTIATAINLGNTTNNIQTTINGTALVKPTPGHDSTTAFQVQNAASSPILGVDTTINKVTVNNTLVVQQQAACNYSGYVSYMLGLSPSAYWKLEDTSGTTAVDSSGNTDTGAISAAGVTLNQTPGPFSCATSHPSMAFNAANSGTITTPTTFANGSFSLVALFKTTSGGALISSTGTRGMYVGSDGKLYGAVWNGANYYAVSPGSVADGNWHEAVMTFSPTSGQLNLYLDGTLAATTTGFVFNGGPQWQIGYLSGSWTNLPNGGYFTGNLAQVAAFTSLLSGAQVASLAGDAGLYTSSIGYLGVNTATPQYPLDAVGDINTSTQYRVNGTVVCISSGCTPAAGSNNYVQLQGSTPGTAQTGNFNISGTGIAGTLQAGTLQATSSVKTSLLDTAAAGTLTLGSTNATAITIGKTSSNITTTITGTTLIKPSSGNDSSTAFQVQNAAGSTTLLDVDSTVNKITLNSGLSINTTTPSPSCNYSSYLTQVAGLTPTIYWKLEDTSGSTATDSSGNGDAGAISATGVTLNQTPGAFNCASSHPMMSFNGASSGYIISSQSFTNPTAFSLIALFKTSSDGDIISFSNTGNSNYDRTMYVGGDGKLYGGIYNGSVNTINGSATVNDNNWHLAVMTYSSTSGGLKLYLDGNLVASNSSLTGSNNVSDWWVVGHMPNLGWVNLVDPYFTGSISQVAVIPSVISATTVTNLAQYSGYTTGNASGVGIGLAGSPSYLLDVGGDINTSTQYRIAGTVVCTSAGCTPAAGSNNYVQLQGSTPGTAQTGYFNISGTGIATTLQASTFDTSSAGALAIGASNATSIALGSTTSNIQTTINGTALVKPTSGHDSTTAFQVQSASGAAMLTVDTTNSVLILNSGLATKVVATGANYTMTEADWGILATGGTSGITITLPSAATTGQIVWIKKVDSAAGVVTVTRAGTDTIEGATSVTLASQYNGIYLIAGGSGVWYRIP